MQDNAPAHTCQVAMPAVTKFILDILPYSPYSPDLASSDFCLFPNLKINLCGRHFRSIEGIIDAFDYLGDQKEGFCFDGISKLEQHLRKCTEAKEIILRNNGTTSALGHSQSTGAKNFWNVPSSGRAMAATRAAALGKVFGKSF